MVKGIKDIGIGYFTGKNAKQTIKAGKPNVVYLNRSTTFDDLYTYLIDISWAKFGFFTILGYFLMNAFFAFVYMLVCPEEFNFLNTNNVDHWYKLFLFSSQTITTVGYGVYAPIGKVAGLIASVHALIGLLSFTFLTGLLYGRFSRPKAKVLFSDFMILRKFEGENALMFRLMNQRKNVMIEPEIKVTISVTELINGAYQRKFYNLELTRNKIIFLPSMWTVVHKIDENSPLFDYSVTELRTLDAEVFVLFQYHEEAFNQNLYQMYSYDFHQLKMGYKFENSYSFNNEGFMVVDYHQLNQISKDELFEGDSN